MNDPDEALISRLENIAAIDVSREGAARIRELKLDLKAAIMKIERLEKTAQNM
jgi:hypothetical protein